MSVQLIPYLVFDGNTKEAIHFYEKALDGRLLYSQTFGEMPENPEYPLPAEARDRVAHAHMKVGDADLMFSDTFPGSPHQSGNQVTICITTPDREKAQRMYHALSDGGHVNMPFQETHFSPGYGNVTDKYGVTFHIVMQSDQ